MEYRIVNSTARGVLFLVEAYILPISFMALVERVSHGHPVAVNSAAVMIGVYFVYQLYLASKGMSVFKKVGDMKVMRYKDGVVVEAGPLRLILREIVKYPTAVLIIGWEFTKILLAVMGMMETESTTNHDRKVAANHFNRTMKETSRARSFRTLIDQIFGTVVVKEIPNSDQYEEKSSEAA